MSEESNAVEATRTPERVGGLMGIYRMVLKLIGASFLAFAIWHWYQIIGFADEDIRFDTMPNQWRMASVALAIIQPVVAIGLWAAFPWGVAVWIIAALIEVVMYGYFVNLFGQNQSVIAFHCACALILAAFQIAIRYRARNEKGMHPFNKD